MRYYKINKAERKENFVMKRIINIIGLFLALFINVPINCSIITTLDKNDPAPLYSTNFPYAYLSQNEKEYLKEHTDFCDPQWFSISASPFYQTASHGKNINQHTSELGDLTRKWNMIAVLPYNNTMSDIPEGDEPFPKLEKIRDNLLHCIHSVFRHTTDDVVPRELKSVQGLLSLQHPDQLFGFFSVPIKYRKIGVRFDLQARIFRDFGCAFQAGVADISQLGRFIDQTATPSACAYNLVETGSTPPGCISACSGKTVPPVYCLNPFTGQKVSNAQWAEVVDCVHIELMDKLQNVADEIDMSLCNYNRTGIEDLHFEFWWRHMFNIKPSEPEPCWLPFLFVPFASLGVDIATAQRSDPNIPLSLPLQNNGHNTVRFNAGFSLDFFDTIEIGMHSGFVCFFKRNICNLRVPTNDFQNVMIPYQTNAEVRPGPTWHVGLFMNAFHFIDCVSAYVEYLYVSHIKDKITVCSDNKNRAFKPCVLECISPWNIHLLNGGLNYDVSPNFTLGFAVQIPLTGRNVYKSTTYLLSTTLTF